MKKKIILFLILLVSIVQATAASTINYCVDPSAKRQTIEGWGVSLCWWANMCGKWSDSQIDEIVDWLVSPTGLNYNIFRYNIGGGDDPQHRKCKEHHMASGKGLRAEMEGFKQYSTDAYDWTRDAAQRKIMLKIKEKRPDAIFEAFSNSAPYYMTYSGCCAGNIFGFLDNLNPLYYKDFANYLVDVCKHYKDTYGIEFKTLEPFNEPMTSYWSRGGSQEGCHFNISSMIAFVKILNPILKASGLKTVIAVSDETDVSQSVTDYKEFKKDKEAFAAIGQWNTHSYKANDNARAELKALTRADNIPLWMSEVGDGGSGISGNLSLSQTLMNDLKYMVPQAWLDWQYVEEGNDQWCTVKGNFANATYQRIKNYYVRQQVTRFIKKGYTLLSVIDGQTLAALSPTSDSLIIVSQNNTAGNISYKADLSLFKNITAPCVCYRTDNELNCSQTNDIEIIDKSIGYTLSPYSIATIIVPVSGADETSEWRTNREYLIVPRRTNLVIQSNGNNITIENYDPDNPTQLWTLSQNNNKYKFINQNIDKLTDNGSYYLCTSANDENGQQFIIEKIEEGVVKIISARTNNVLDLEGEKTAVGTKVGIWEYGNSPSATHRQWLLLSAPDFSASETTNIDNVNQQSPNCRIYSIDGTVYILKEAKKAHISIYDTNGRIVYEENTAQTFITKSLPKGFYVISITQNKKIKMQKIMVN